MAFFRKSMRRLRQSIKEESIDEEENLSNSKFYSSPNNSNRRSSNQRKSSIISAFSIFSNDSDLLSIAGDNYSLSAFEISLDNDENIETETIEQQIISLIDKFINEEHIYVSELRNGIDKQQKMFNETALHNSHLRGQNNFIFTSIEKIFKLHGNKLSIELNDCGKDINKIVQVFQKHLDLGNFYIYTLHAYALPLIRKRVRESNLDIKSLLMLLELPKFSNYFNFFLKIKQIICDHYEEYKELNDSLKKLLYDLQGVINACIGTHYLLRMDFNEYECYVDIRNKGKFIKCNEFEITEVMRNKKFTGMVYLFEKCVIFSERSVNRKKFLVRGYYDINTLLCHCLDDKKIKFLLINTNSIDENREFMKLNNDTDIEFWLSFLKQNIAKVKNPEIMKKQKKNNKNFLCDGTTRNSFEVIEFPRTSTNTFGCPNMTSISNEINLKFDSILLRNMKSMDRSFSSWIETTKSDLITEKLFHIISELYSTEFDYIKTLQDGIRNYIEPFNNPISLPISLRGHKYAIFNGTEKIYNFHKNHFTPTLLKCEYDLDKIFNTFTTHINANKFYIYILNALGYHRSMLVSKEHSDYFEKWSRHVHDKLGLNSFILQPSRRLSKYVSIFQSINSELLKIKNRPEALILLEKFKKAHSSLHSVLTTINDLHKLHTLKFDSDKYVNFTHQGKFLKYSELLVCEKKKNHLYTGAVFLFENSLIYAEVENKSKLEPILLFRGSYSRDELGISFPDETKRKFVIFREKQDRDVVEFSKIDGSNINDWDIAIRKMLVFVVEKEKKKIEKRLSKRFSTKFMFDQYKRNSAISLDVDSI